MGECSSFGDNAKIGFGDRVNHNQNNIASMTNHDNNNNNNPVRSVDCRFVLFTMMVGTKLVVLVCWHCNPVSLVSDQPVRGTAAFVITGIFIPCSIG